MINIDKDYVVRIRREIHMYPEVDYDLPKTVALVKRELEALGIPCTEQYGPGSVVGYINPDKTDFTIGIRADMDAGDTNVYFVDGNSLWGEEDWRNCSMDTVHPNDMGHTRMAECVIPIIKTIWRAEE